MEKFLRLVDFPAKFDVFSCSVWGVMVGYLVNLKTLVYLVVLSKSVSMYGVQRPRFDHEFPSVFPESPVVLIFNPGLALRLKNSRTPPDVLLKSCKSNRYHMDI